MNSNRVAPLLCAYGPESHTTANHLYRALIALTDTKLLTPDNSLDGLPPGSNLLWIESGNRWLPDSKVFSVSRRRFGWLIDTHRPGIWRQRLARAFDHVFVAQRDAVATIRRIGGSASWLPLAAPTNLPAGPPLNFRPYDFAFVGSAAPGSRRWAILNELKSRFRMAPVERFVSPSEMMEIYRSAKIVVNIPVSGDLNMRAFEAPGARCVLVTEKVRELVDVLPRTAYQLVDAPGVSAWVEAVSSVLSDPSMQQRADAGYSTVITRHTYEHRARTVLSILADHESTDVGRQQMQALGAGYARFGQFKRIPELPLPSSDRLLLLGEATMWKAASLAHEKTARVRDAGRALTRK